MRMMLFGADRALILSMLSWLTLLQYDVDSEVAALVHPSDVRYLTRVCETFLLTKYGLQDFDHDNRLESLSSELIVKAGYTFRF